MLGKYVIVRSYRAGVFAGTLEKQEGNESQLITLTNARRLWRWYGGASLSQIARYGTSQPENCKFPAEILRVQLINAFEIIECSEEGEKSIKSVPVWSE